MRIIQPASRWDWNEVLLNKVVYYLNVLAWQKTKDGQKKTPQHEPKLFTPEFMKQGNPDPEVETHTVDEIKELLARPRV